MRRGACDETLKCSKPINLLTSKVNSCAYETINRCKHNEMHSQTTTAWWLICFRFGVDNWRILLLPLRFKNKRDVVFWKWTIDNGLKWSQNRNRILNVDKSTNAINLIKYPRKQLYLSNVARFRVDNSGSFSVSGLPDYQIVLKILSFFFTG
jgi:hypothetical protein